MSWSKWYTFDADTISAEAPDYNGVYKIALSDEYVHKYPLGKSDIIYIGESHGESSSIKIRLQAHQGGYGNQCVYSTSQKYNLFFSYRHSEDPEQTEANLLWKFENEFGEEPDCNGRG